MSTTITAESESKFTRGEKCIFIHLTVTFSLIIALVIVYFIHLCTVNHTKQDVLKISRRVSDLQEAEFLSVGISYVVVPPNRMICNTLLLRQRWSLAPAHCTAMRSDPDLAYLLRSWRISYRTENSTFIESEIKRSIPHPHFSRDDYSNNIGLFEHEDAIDTYQYVFPDAFTANDDTFKTYANDMVMLGWEQSTEPGGRRNMKKYILTPVALKKCHHFVAPIVDLRSYEFCVILGQGSSTLLEHGAVFIMDSKIKGMFAWGEKGGKGVPFIVVNILHFKDWLENIMSI